MAYYTTSYALGTGTTNTIALELWRALNEHLLAHQLPMSGEDLSQATGLSLQKIEGMFKQKYYERSYGFRRFETIDEWRAWAEETDLLFIPGVHDVQTFDEEPDAAAEDEDGDTEV